MAERVGFEPTDPVKSLRFSRPTRSTTLPPLRVSTEVPFKGLSAGRADENTVGWSLPQVPNQRFDKFLPQKAKPAI